MPPATMGELTQRSVRSSLAPLHSIFPVVAWKAVRPEAVLTASSVLSLAVGSSRQGVAKAVVPELRGTCQRT